MPATCRCLVLVYVHVIDLTPVSDQYANCGRFILLLNDIRKYSVILWH